MNATEEKAVWRKEAAYRELRNRLRGSVRMDVPLARYTTYRVGGPADLFVRPRDLDDLVEAVRFASSEGIPFFVLGKGANLLVSDRGYRGMVVSLVRRLDGVTLT